MLSPEDAEALKAFVVKLAARRVHAPSAERCAIDDAGRAIWALLNISAKPDPLLAILATLTKHRQVMLDLLPEDVYRDVHDAVEKATR